MDITEFLTARYDEEAGKATYAAELGGATWHHHEAPDHQMHWESGTAIGILATLDLHGFGQHIAAHDPARVLDDIAAKRKRLALYIETEQKVAQALQDAPWKDDPAFAHSYTRERININELSGRYAAYRMSLRLDAAPYAEHPDFDPAWRIDG